MHNRLSTIPFECDTEQEANRLAMAILRCCDPSRDDRVETVSIMRPLADGSLEVTIVVTVHTGNIEGMIEDLRKFDIL